MKTKNNIKITGTESERDQVNNLLDKAEERYPGVSTLINEIYIGHVEYGLNKTNWEKIGWQWGFKISLSRDDKERMAIALFHEITHIALRAYIYIARQEKSQNMQLPTNTSHL